MPHVNLGGRVSTRLVNMTGEQTDETQTPERGPWKQPTLVNNLSVVSHSAAKQPRIQRLNPVFPYTPRVTHTDYKHRTYHMKTT